MSTRVQTLVVGGGSSGSSDTGYAGSSFFGTGGSAGKFVYNPSFLVSVGAYPITVGAGGVGVTGANGNPGSDSIFDTITATGGTYLTSGNSHNRGGDTANGDGIANGSGGGSSAAGVGGTLSALTFIGGTGGAGTSNSITGSPIDYAGGGGGAGYGDGGGGYTGSNGSGTAGGGNAASAFNAGSATANTGSGGGGVVNGFTSGDGGSGVVIISYPTGAITATGGTITTSGGYTIHTFTTSGTFTISAIALITIEIQTDAGGVPSGVLADPNATATVDPGSLTNSFVDTTITFAGSFTLTPGVKYHIVFSSPGLSDVSYFDVGYSASGSRVFSVQEFDGASWNDTPNVVGYAEGEGFDWITKSDSSLPNSNNFFGLSDSAITLGSSGPIATGGISSRLSNLISNQIYEISTDGSIVPYSAGIKVGKAIEPDKFLIVQPPL